MICACEAWPHTIYIVYWPQTRVRTMWRRASPSAFEFPGASREVSARSMRHLYILYWHSQRLHGIHLFIYSSQSESAPVRNCLLADSGSLRLVAIFVHPWPEELRIDMQAKATESGGGERQERRSW